MNAIIETKASRVLARRRVPRTFYDFVDSGSCAASTYRANEEKLQKITLRQRLAMDLENRSSRTSMIGQDVTMPVALVPTGLTGMRGADGEILAACVATVHWVKRLLRGT